MGAEPLTVAAYAGALDALAATLEAGDLARAGEQAARLREERITFAGGVEIDPDPVLLRAISRARPFEATALARRTAALAAALRASPAGIPPPPDRGLLERLRRAGEAPSGGAVATPRFRPLPERIADTLARISQSVADALARLWEWLKKLWPEERADRRAAPGALGFTLGVVAAALVVLVVLAVRWRRRPVTPLAAPAPAERSHADADPLSRESGEWQTYARELAAAGRTREAIRAWYHAVLVALFRAGALEPRKGRTNWEHAARLGPAVPYRADFLDITRLFDREWYGRDESRTAALDDCAASAAAILESVRAGDRA
jgi:hypothetical protein